MDDKARLQLNRMISENDVLDQQRPHESASNNRELLGRRSCRDMAIIYAAHMQYMTCHI